MRQSGIDPIGSAVHVEAFLMVETPRPWPNEAVDVATLAPLVPMLTRAARDGRPHRLQALAAGDPSSGAPTKVIRYSRDPRNRSTMVGHEYHCADVSQLADLCEAVVMGRATAPVGTPLTGGDLLVCTHGARDRCCGREGSRLFDELRSDPPSRPRRIWRTSHLGGHRYAPTVVTLPDARSWAHVSSGLLRAIADRAGPIEAVVEHYRGSCLAPNAAVQAAERAALLRFGWEWLDVSWRCDTSAESGAETVVSLSFEGGPGETRVFEAVVRHGRTLQIPPCMGVAGPPVDAAEVEVVATSVG